MSFAQRRPIDQPVTTRIADGMACRTPEPDALEVLWQHMARVVQVSDDEVEAAMRLMFQCHAQHRRRSRRRRSWPPRCRSAAGSAGKKAAFVQSGGNVDSDVFARVLVSTGKLKLNRRGAEKSGAEESENQAVKEHAVGAAYPRKRHRTRQLHREPIERAPSAAPCFLSQSFSVPVRLCGPALSLSQGQTGIGGPARTGVLRRLRGQELRRSSNGSGLLK